MNEVILEKLKLTAISKFQKEMIYPQDVKLSIDKQTEFLYDSVLLRMIVEIMGKLQEDTTVKYPSDWKESLKERFLPYWLKKHFPVKYTEKAIYKVCPHIDTKFSDNPNIHLRFLDSIQSLEGYRKSSLDVDKV
jgi:hypothetical protein